MVEETQAANGSFRHMSADLLDLMVAGLHQERVAPSANQRIELEVDGESALGHAE